MTQHQREGEIERNTDRDGEIERQGDSKTAATKNIHTTLKPSPIDCVKGIRIPSYSGTHFPAFGLNTDRIPTEYGEIRSICPYSARMRENAHQNNSEYGHFSRSDSSTWIVIILITEGRRFIFSQSEFSVTGKSQNNRCRKMCKRTGTAEKIQYFH